MEWRAERKGKSKQEKTWGGKMGKEKREKERGREHDHWHCRLFQGSLRSPEVLRTCLDCKAWWQHRLWQKLKEMLEDLLVFLIVRKTSFDRLMEGTFAWEGANTGFSSR